MQYHRSLPRPQARPRVADHQCVRPSEAARNSAQSVAEVQRRHPNATLAGGAGATGTIFVWFSTEVMGLPMDATASAAFITVFSSGTLLIGRRGLKGVLKGVWYGSSNDG